MTMRIFTAHEAVSQPCESAFYSMPEQHIEPRHSVQEYGMPIISAYYHTTLFG